MHLIRSISSKFVLLGNCCNILSTGGPWVGPAQIQANLVGHRGGTRGNTDSKTSANLGMFMMFNNLNTLVSIQKVLLVYPRWPAKYESKTRRPAGSKLCGIRRGRPAACFIRIIRVFLSAPKLMNKSMRFTQQ